MMDYKEAVKKIGAKIADRVWDNYLGGGNKYVYEQGRTEADVLVTIYGGDFRKVHQDLTDVYSERFNALRDAHLSEKVWAELT